MGVIAISLSSTCQIYNYITASHRIHTPRGDEKSDIDHILINQPIYIENFTSQPTYFFSHFLNNSINIKKHTPERLVYAIRTSHRSKAS